MMMMVVTGVTTLGNRLKSSVSKTEVVGSFLNWIALNYLMLTPKKFEKDWSKALATKSPTRMNGMWVCEFYSIQPKYFHNCWVTDFHNSALSLTKLS